MVVVCLFSSINITTYADIAESTLAPKLLTSSITQKNDSGVDTRKVLYRKEGEINKLFDAVSRAHEMGKKPEWEKVGKEASRIKKNWVACYMGPWLAEIYADRVVSEDEALHAREDFRLNFKQAVVGINRSRQEPIPNMDINDILLYADEAFNTLMRSSSDSGWKRQLSRIEIWGSESAEHLTLSPEGDGSMVVMDDSKPFNDEEMKVVYEVLEEIEGYLEELGFPENHPKTGASMKPDYERYENQKLPVYKVILRAYGMEGWNYEFENIHQDEYPPLIGKNGQPQPTRSEIIKVIEQKFKERGCMDFSVSLNRNTIITIVKKGVTKTRGIRKLLEEGPVVYFGDETGLGNDREVSEMAIGEDALLTVGLDKKKKVEKKEKPFPKGVAYTGGLTEGLKKVLKRFTEILKENNTVMPDNKAIAEAFIQAVRDTADWALLKEKGYRDEVDKKLGSFLKAASRSKKPISFAFDSDGTLTTGRGAPIDEETGNILAEMMSFTKGKIAVLTGKLREDLRECYIPDDLCLIAHKNSLITRERKRAIPEKYPGTDEFDEFKRKYFACYTLFAHKAVNEYIKSQIPQEGIEALQSRTDKVIISETEQQEIIIVAIPDLLKNTGQLAHIGLGSRNGVPTAYVDSTYFYDEDVLAHEKDEIASWERKRKELDLTYKEMREWIKTNPEAKKLASEFHASSYSLESSHSRIQEKYQNLLDLDNIYAAYLAYGFDVDDNDVNIAAHKKKKRDEAISPEIIKMVVGQCQGIVQTLDMSTGDKCIERELKKINKILKERQNDKALIYALLAVDMYEINKVIMDNTDDDSLFFSNPILFVNDHVRKSVKEFARQIKNAVASYEREKYFPDSDVRVVATYAGGIDKDLRFLKKSTDQIFEIFPELRRVFLNLPAILIRNLKWPLAAFDWEGAKTIKISKEFLDLAKKDISIFYLLGSAIAHELDHARFDSSYKLGDLIAWSVEFEREEKNLTPITPNTLNPFVYFMEISACLTDARYTLTQMERLTSSEQKGVRKKLKLHISRNLEGVKCALNVLKRHKKEKIFTKKGEQLLVEYTEKLDQLEKAYADSLKKKTPTAVAKNAKARKKDKGCPEKLLEDIRNNDILLRKALSEEGISRQEILAIRDWSERTVDREVEILKALGIFVPIEEKTGHYKFSDMMKGPNENYTKTMINAINDIKYQVGQKGEERPLNRYDIPKDKRPAVKELIKMTVLHQANLMQRSATLENKVLWHIIERDVLSDSQKNSFAQQINTASMKSGSPERIWILKREETIKEAIAKIKAICPNAVFDVALSSPDHIEKIPALEGEKEIKMLVFKGTAGDFSQIEGVIAALRALHLKKEQVIPALLRIYSIMAGAPYTGEIPSEATLEDVREFARKFIFDLPPATELPVDDIPKLNERLKELLIAA